MKTSKSKMNLKKKNMEPSRNKKHRQYSIEDFESKMSVYKAAKEFNVPRKTPSNRVNGLHGKDIGRKTYLTNEKEILLVN